MRPAIDRLLRRIDSAVTIGNTVGNMFARTLASLFTRKR